MPTSGVRFWAALVSVATHLLVLLILAATKLSPCDVKHNNAAPVQAGIVQARKLLTAEPVTAKPQVVKKAGRSHIRKGRRESDIGRTILSEDRAAVVTSSRLQQTTDSGTGLRPSSEAGLMKPRLELFGSENEGRRVCYVVDRSGSMHGVFGRVKQRLQKSIRNLEPDQYFGLIFFGDDDIIEFGGGVMFRAAEKVKSSAYKFIASVEPGGGTNASQALRRVFHIRDRNGGRPEVIYFLTDGFELAEGKRKDFVKAIKFLRQRYLPDAKINTIGFWPVEKDRDMLATLALQNKGTFVLVGDNNDDTKVDSKAEKED